jgi:hypothetical protein
MSLRPIAIGLAMLTLVLASPAASQDPGSEEPAWLIVFQGDTTAISAEQMTIAAGPWGMAFTDRPGRQVRIVNLSTLVANAWGEDGTFRRNPPNAALIDETGSTIGIIEIGEAAWQDGVMTVSFSSLEGALPAVGDHIALVIDDGTVGAMCDLFPRPICTSYSGAIE